MVTIDTLPYLLWIRPIFLLEAEPHEVIKHNTPTGIMFQCRSVYRGYSVWLTQEGIDKAKKAEQL